MKTGIRSFIQYAVVHTGFFPLTCIYRAIYDISVNLASFIISRTNGVITIYLRRGVARGETAYGLSDIDLTVIVEDGKQAETKNAVRRRYRCLSLLLPFLGNVDKELGLYSLSELHELYHRYDSYKFRLNEGKRSWKLLFGRDIVKSLPEPQKEGLYLPSTEELKTWWYFLVSEFVLYSTSPHYKKKYLWYKAIAEASKIYLFLARDEFFGTRENALSRVMNYLTPDLQHNVEIVRGYLKSLSSKEQLPVDDLMRLFTTLSARIYEEMERKLRVDSKALKATIILPNKDAILAKHGINKEELVSVIERELGAFVSSISIVPQIEFGQEVLYNSHIDSLNLVLMFRNHAPIEKLSKLYSIVSDKLQAADTELFIMPEDDIAFSLQRDAKRNTIKILSKVREPLFFAMLPSGDLKISQQSDVESADKVLPCHLPFNEFRKTIKDRTIKIEEIAANRDVFKMKTLDFSRFFWAAARTKLIGRHLESEEIRIPLTSEQIVEVLIQSFPEDANWLRDLHKEYCKDLHGEENESYRYFSQALGILNRI